MGEEGLTATIVWTQVVDAIFVDYGIKLPERTGIETTKTIREVAALAKLRAENQELREALGKIKRVLGPSAPSCDGCATEIGEALKIIEEVVNERA